MTDAVTRSKRTPLYECHLRAGGRIVPFSGWEMPVQYTGIIDEHMHTREKTGLFDICHMGEFILKGAGAEKDLEHLFSRKVGDMLPGKCRYGFLLNDKGTIIDDIIVFKVSPEEFMLVVNAGTIDKDAEWIKKNISESTVFADISESTAKLDLQGPLSADVLKKCIDPAVVEGLKRFSFTDVSIDGVKVILSRTGYTGELGYELFFSPEFASKLWDKLLVFPEVKPVGLGARDTLRLEEGYSLYGSDIDEDHTPVEAGLSKFVSMEKDFIGRAALKEQEASGVSRVLTGFICEGRRSARSHFRVMDGSRDAGEVTSGAFSPCLKKGIGLCYIDKGLAVENREISLMDGKVQIEAKVKSLPIYEH
ncbi:MAG: glycine cleavage system aminomethyltransferase GcvT [Candidatus Tantalella remota]|nr:glycine cleavage system aminomethyltransferase GcvT [Candidatus Tantalella remota]